MKTGLEDPETIFRFLNNLIADMASDMDKQAQSCFQEMKQKANEAGFVLEIPDLTYPMGVSYGMSDVTGHVGKQWSEKKKRV